MENIQYYIQKFQWRKLRDCLKMGNKKEIEKEYGFWIIGGTHYQASPLSKDGKSVLVEVSEKVVKRKIKKLKELAERLKENLDREAVMIEALSKLDDGALEQIHNVVFNIKRKTKVKTRKHYCVDMKVGRYIIPIVD